MELKKITAIVRTSILEEVEHRLRAVGVKGLTVTHVVGFGEYANFFRDDWHVGHARVEIFADLSKVETIIAAVMDAAHTGRPGDGIIAVTPVERVFRIRERAEAPVTAL